MGKVSKFTNNFNYTKTVLYLKLKLFRSADILITTRCSTGCRFCIYRNIPKQDMPIETIDRGLSLYKKLNIKQIRICGGEPFEAYGKLLYTAKKILEFMPPEKIYLITSANWATTKVKTEEMLNPLVVMGLKNFIISIDAFHLEKINKDNIVKFLDYFKKKNMKVIIFVRYNNQIKKYMKFFHSIKNKYDVEFSTCSIGRLGGAALLNEREIKADKYEMEKFIKIFDRGEKIVRKIKNAFQSCLYLTLFPNGDLHFCCVKRKGTKICNIKTSVFHQSLNIINKNWLGNVYKSISASPQFYSNNCDFCPICVKKEK
jgi:MoaA/NifB/PqqE/SkfB family radical SAM enzyme